MRRKRPILKWNAVLLLAVLFTAAGAQNKAKDEFRKIADRYKQVKDMSMVVDMKLYSTYESKTAVETETMVFKRSGNNFYEKVSGMETIGNTDYQLTIDHNAQRIVIKDRVIVKELPDISKVFNINMDSLIATIDTIPGLKPEFSLADQPGGKKSIRIDSPYGEYSSMVIFYNKEYLLEKVMLYYNEELPIASEKETAAPRIEMHYRTMDVKTTHSPALFDEKPYVNISGMEVSGKGKLAGYKVINLLNSDVHAN